MSDILNHYHCAREAYQALPENHYLTDVIADNFDAFRLGSQGPDFFYYDVLEKNHKLAIHTARSIHSVNIDKFFFYGLKFAQEYPEYAQVCLAYLCGFASHHALDVFTHPFIFHRTGKVKQGEPETYKYQNLHKLYEILLDTAMTQYEYSRQAVFESPEKVFIVTPYTLQFLEAFYSYILPKVYGIDLPKKVIKDSLKSAARIIAFCKDPLGRFRKYGKFVEKKLGYEHALTQFFYPMYTNEYLILNIGQKLWRDPVTGEEHYESYPQLFHRSVEKTKEYFELLSSLFQRSDFSLEEISKSFEDRSYLTGHVANENDSFIYFDEDFIQELSETF